MADEGVFEMLWDCQACGTRRLLGLSQRFCPNCGSAQDPARRYFPSDDEKVAVADHEYVGADRLCGYCRAPQSAKASHCTNCGAPLERSREVAQRADQQRPDDQGAARFAAESVEDAKRERKAAAAPPPAPAPSRGWIKWAVGAGLVVALLVGLATATRKPAGFVVSAHRWERVVHVERYGPAPASAWCDQLPFGAYQVSRSREVRAHNRIQQGEDCQLRRHDNGDGTYRQTRECSPRYVDQPVYDDRCHFLVDAWQPTRDLTESGGLADPPRWPTVNLRGGQCHGCEREGGRSESYTVTLLDEKGKPHRCGVEAGRFAAMAPGSSWSGETGMLLGDLRCSSLVPR